MAKPYEINCGGVGLCCITKQKEEEKSCFTKVSFMVLTKEAR
jgi:uncharacterized cysteine cluster protein YcgN (CxxCxxCC family)